MGLPRPGSSREVDRANQLASEEGSIGHISANDYHLRHDVEADRSIAVIKTLTFAVMHFVIAFTVAYLLTGDLVIGGAVALVEPAVNTVGFYLHEKVWQRLGRRHRSGQGRPPMIRRAVAA
jgi:uncharacterized membrane protein